MRTIIFATGNEHKMVEIRMILEGLGARILSQKEVEIDYLNKEPGIYSARYLGEDTSYDIKNNALLERMAGVPDEERTARFVCAIAAVFPGGESEVVRGTMEGRVGYEIAGENGFGYDPIFYLPECGCTSAQLAPEKKNELSHRGEGLRKMREILLKKWEREDEDTDRK